MAEALYVGTPLCVCVLKRKPKDTESRDNLTPSKTWGSYFPETLKSLKILSLCIERFL